jgi:membrane protein DedA with SNARE-associated domain
VSGLIASLEPYLHQYGYWAVFAAILLEDFGVPTPGETFLIAGALLASQGSMHIVPLLLVAWAGAVIGDNIGYAIGRFGGRVLALRYGRYVGLNLKRLEYAEGFFRRHGGIVVVVARFIELLRQLNGIIAGIAKMRWSRFLSYNALGAALWVGFWGMLFFELGKGASRYAYMFEHVQVYLVGGAVVAAAVAAVYVVRKRRNRAT